MFSNHSEGSDDEEMHKNFNEKIDLLEQKNKNMMIQFNKNDEKCENILLNFINLKKDLLQRPTF